jgi:hypothetical protein
MSQPITLLGEPLDVLVAFLGHLKETRTVEAEVDPLHEAPEGVSSPFLRAWMRQEAILLRSDADRLTDLVEPRTYEQRMSDALSDLVLNIIAAMRYTGRKV